MQSRPDPDSNAGAAGQAPWLLCAVDIAFLLVFAFATMMGNPTPVSSSHDVPLPTDRATGQNKVGIAAVPSFEGNSWVYADLQGAKISAAALVARARNENKAVILVMDGDSAIQAFLAARAALVSQDRTIPIALGMRKETPP